jgi:gluconokinase
VIDAKQRPEFLVLAMDIGTSSARSALFDDRARHLPETNAREEYAVRYSSDGGAELAPQTLRRATACCLKKTLTVHRDARALRKIPITVVAGSGFWHSLLGLDFAGKAITPILTWADARSAGDAKRLREKLSERAIQLRTGCLLRSSFWPAKLRWLHRTQPRLFARVSRWISPIDWIFAQLFESSVCSASMASATGLYDHNKKTWDEELCEICGVREDQLSPICASAPFARRAPVELRGATIFAAIGDGAAGNLGSSADRSGCVAINVGTSAAVRMLQPNRHAFQAKLPLGLFRYVVDSNHSVIGGAVSNAGNLRSWCLRELRLDETASAMRRSLARVSAADESITVLPFWVNERAPTWPENQSGTVVGLTQATSAAEIFRAATTSVFNRISQILDLLETALGRAERVIVAGGVVRSMPMLQVLADAIGHDLEVCREPEASLRGAAVHALNCLGDSPAPLPKGKIISYDSMLAARHRENRERQIALEKLLAHFRLGRRG